MWFFKSNFAVTFILFSGEIPDKDDKNFFENNSFEMHSPSLEWIAPISIKYIPILLSLLGI